MLGDRNHPIGSSSGVVTTKFVFRTNRLRLASIDSLGNGRVLPIKVNANQTLNRKGDDHGYLYFIFANASSLFVGDDGTDLCQLA